MADLKKLARGQDCQVRIPEVCNDNPETTVLAHVYASGTKAMSKKGFDLIGTWACYNCHMAIDGGLKTPYSHETLQNYAFEGMIRTQIELIKKNKVTW